MRSFPLTIFFLISVLSHLSIAFAAESNEDASTEPVANQVEQQSGDLVFSGPQVGEKLAPFDVKSHFGEDAGKTIKLLDDPKGATMLIFMHQITRPAIGMTRLLATYAETKKQDGLNAQLVFLTDDPTETEAFFRRAQRALPKEMPPVISVDGIDGPGAYGLNRKMTMTILIGKDGKVTANFPLVQPSIQADAAKIGHEIVKALGGEEAPTLEEMGFKPRQMNMRMRANAQANKNPGPELTDAQNATYRQMIAPVIRGQSPEAVAEAARKVEAFAAKTPWFKQKVHHASNMIVNGGKLTNYGGKEAQDYLTKWAKEFAPKADGPAPRQRESATKKATPETVDSK